MDLKLTSIDLAKTVFQIAALDSEGKVAFNRQISRARLIVWLQNCPPMQIVMESCGTSNYWARLAQRCGHTARQLPANAVKPYRRGNKNDANDAIAILEAAQRPDIIPVPVKTVEQIELQAIHNIRQRLVGARTALLNQIRSLCAEHGLITRRSPGALMRALPLWLEDADNELGWLGRELINELRQELTALDERIARCQQRLVNIAEAEPLCQRLMEARGVGVVTATAIVAAVGRGDQFNNGRAFAAWIGLTPGHTASGGKCIQLGITKRGNTYLRTLLIHGARTVMNWAAKHDDPLSQWALAVKSRAGHNRAIVALANKNARILWAMMHSDEPYRYAV
jgi:transposase